MIKKNKVSSIIETLKYHSNPKRANEATWSVKWSLGHLKQLVALDGHFKGRLSTHVALRDRQTAPSASIDHISLISTLICEPFKALDS